MYTKKIAEEILIWCKKLALIKTEIEAKKLNVHYSDYGPDIHIVCDDTWTLASMALNAKNGLPSSDVYLTDDDRIYTFEKELVSCFECAKKIS